MNQKILEFNKRVHAEWSTDEAAAAWQKHSASMRKQMAQVTEALVNAAEPANGISILDLASGVGEPALSLAKSVAPNGTVTATDFNPAMLAALQENAAQENITNIKTQVCDAHHLDFPNETFDRVTSRFGVMFCGDIDSAFSEVRRVLKPNGKIAFMVWGQPIPGSYFATSALPFIKRMAQKPDPDGPGPLRFAQPGKLLELINQAGFSNAKESLLNIPAPFNGTPSEMFSQIMEIAAPLRNIAANLASDDAANGTTHYQDAVGEAMSQLTELHSNGTIHLTAPVLIVTATN